MSSSEISGLIWRLSDLDQTGSDQTLPVRKVDVPYQGNHLPVIFHPKKRRHVRSSSVRSNPPPAPRSREPIRVAPSRPRNSQHFEELEAYRGVAALLIVVFHAYQYSRQATHQPKYVYEGLPIHQVIASLEAGVAWFFALSGFLLFLPIARSCIQLSPRQSTRSFLVRRAIRILPLYYFAILVVWCWRFTGGPGQWRDLINHLTFTHTFDDDRLFWTIGPAWSLAVEVHYYIALALIAPLLYGIAKRLPSQVLRTILVFGFVAMLWTVGIGYNWWAEHIAHIPHTQASAYFSLPAKLDNFASGMLLASIVASTNGRLILNRPLAWLLRGAGLGVIAATFAVRDYSSGVRSISAIDTYFHSISAIAFTVIIASTVIGPRKSLWTAVLARPNLQMLGVLSYSIYMWHEPILIEMGQRGYLISTIPEAFTRNTVYLIVMSVAVAWATYRAIELPTLELRHVFGSNGKLAERYPRIPAPVRNEMAPVRIPSPVESD